MKTFLIPIFLLFVGVGGGVGAGIMLGPSAGTDDDTPAEAEADVGSDSAEEPPAMGQDIAASSTPAENGARGVEFFNMTNQFVVPLVKDGQVNGIIVVAISLEVVEGTIADVHLREPKLRDRFLQVLFNHANNGGFEGNFTDFRYIKSLKEELLRNAQVVAGRDVKDVLILDLVRQDP